MSEPPYWDMKCRFRGCSNLVRVWLNPAEVSLHPQCKPCRTKRRTHLSEPLCAHGNIINHISSSTRHDPPCGCTPDKNADDIAWDWVSIKQLIEETEAA